MTRVVITSAAAVSPIGNNFEQVMAGIAEGKRGIKRVEKFKQELFQYNFGGTVELSQQEPTSGGPQGNFFKLAMGELVKANNGFKQYAPENRFLNLGTSLDYLDIKGYVSSGDVTKGNWQQWTDYNNDVVERTNVGCVDAEISAGPGILLKQFDQHFFHFSALARFRNKGTTIDDHGVQLPLLSGCV